MADAPKTSFIPKQSMGAVQKKAPRRRHFNILNFVGMVVFLLGLILAVGVFFYKDLSAKELESEKASLAQIKNSFSVGDIESLRELHRRIGVAQSLLDAHLSPTSIFEMLEERTQQDVRFTDFSYQRRESGSAEVVLNGSTFRFSTVVLQSREFTDIPAFASSIFTDVSVGEDGTVNFMVTSEANTSALRYAAPVVEETPVDTGTTTEGVSGAGEEAVGGEELDAALDGLEELISDTEGELNESL